MESLEIIVLSSKIVRVLRLGGNHKNKKAEEDILKTIKTLSNEEFSELLRWIRKEISPVGSFEIDLVIKKLQEARSASIQ